MIVKVRMEQEAVRDVCIVIGLLNLPCRRSHQYIGRFQIVAKVLGDISGFELVAIIELIRVFIKIVHS